MEFTITFTWDWIKNGRAWDFILNKCIGPKHIEKAQARVLRHFNEKKDYLQFPKD